MLHTSTSTLHLLAAGVWYTGSFVLLIKGSSLLFEADELRPGQIWPIVGATAGLLVGGLKGWLLFTKSCHKNLDRIGRLRTPRLWQFFSPVFFLFLAIMIAAGATLSRMAHGNYPFSIAVAILDLGVGSALLLSSYVFWKRRRLG